VPSEEAGFDWRRLAADRNVSHTVARALWHRAHASAPDDPMQAELAFHSMLDDAEAANATHEPGRETLVDATPARDASSLGAGKWTRVLLEEQKPGGRARSAKRGPETVAQAPAERGTENAKQPSAEELRNKLVAAGEASKNAAALLAASDPATIVEALRELRAGDGASALQKIMSVAGGAIARMLDQRSQDPQIPTGPVGDAEPDTNRPTPPPGAPGPAAANRTPAASTPASAPANRTPAAKAPDSATAPVEPARSSRPPRS
jgi:hypothetical protein